MQQIIKRLKIIKMSISCEDEDVIGLQISKLNAKDIDQDIQEILDILGQHDYLSAITAINNYINKYTGLIVYEDEEVQGLKLELKLLEKYLQKLSQQKSEYTNDLDDFNRDYSLKLGKIIQNILTLKQDITHHHILKQQQKIAALENEYQSIKSDVENCNKRKKDLEKELADLDETDPEYEELNQEYQDLKFKLNEKEHELNNKQKAAEEAREAFINSPENEEYEEAKEDSRIFEEEYKEVIEKDCFDLNEDQLHDLKKAHRKAIRLCHPDIVSDKLKKRAHEITAELNSARQKKDLSKVLEILAMLESGESFNVASDTIFDKDLLKAKIEKLKEKVELLNSEINELQDSDTFKEIMVIEDRDEYFSHLKKQLETEVIDLEEKLHQLQADQENYTDIDLDESYRENYYKEQYWEEEF